MIADDFRDFCNDKGIERIMAKAVKLGIPTREVEHCLLAAAQAGCQRSREELLTRHAPFVVKMSANYRNMGMPMLDIFQQGMMGLDKAITRFDLSKHKSRLITYAVWWIRQSILYEMSTSEGAFRIPVNRQAQMSKLRRMMRVARSENRTLSDEQIARALKVSLNIAQMLIAASVEPISLQDSEYRRRGGDDCDGDFSELVGATDHDHLADEDEYEWAVEMMQRAPKITQKEIRVVMERTLAGRTLDDIAQDYKCSRERIRQVELSALTKIRRAVRKMDLKQGITPAERSGMITIGG